MAQRKNIIAEPPVSNEAMRAEMAALADEERRRVGQQIVTAKVTKKTTKAQNIAQKRPYQITVHFFQEEKRIIRNLLADYEDEGVVNPTQEELIHSAFAMFAKLPLEEQMKYFLEDRKTLGLNMKCEEI